MSFMPIETRVRKVCYHKDQLVTLTLQHPNVSLTIDRAQIDNPKHVAWRLKNTFGGRHTASGRAFTDLTLGRQQKRWREILSLAEEVTE